MKPLKVGVLVDLALTSKASGHVKTWERLAEAAADIPDAIDLTVHFSGAKEDTMAIAGNVRYQLHAPVFSTARLPFLSHVPDHSDLGPHHLRLARHLPGYDVIHTTDGAFAFARTAARVARRRAIPLCSSAHTNIPRYTRIFTAATVERVAGRGRLAHVLLDGWDVARRAEAVMQKRVDDHLDRCLFVMAARLEDRARLMARLGRDRVSFLRRGIDLALFDPARRDPAWLRAAMGIPSDRCVVISVGRLDRSKSVMTIAQAVRRLADAGMPVHLLCTGDGADRDAVKAVLGDHGTCPGILPPETVARALASADLCAQPSEVEEWSNASQEALASGLPAVVAAASGSGRLIREGETGHVLTDPDPEAWAGALAPLVADPARRAAMGRAARAWACANLPTWRAVLEQDLLAVWRRAAGAGAAGGGRGDGDGVAA